MAEENKQQSSNPLFYKEIEVLNKSAHDKLRIKDITDLEFAKTANSIILTASEFSAAAPFYPIVFAKEGGNYTPYAVTGYRNGENVFVNEENKWKPETYIPAYVRRYPFILAESSDKKTLSLAIDTQCSAVNKRSGNPLYSNDEPSELSKRALDFCARFRKDLEGTHQLMKQLAETGILVERTANVKIADKEPGQIGGFSIVDETLLGKLDDEKFLELRKSGLLVLIYCHLWSMRSWDALIADW